ncbi:hypothetical protein GG496_000950 [Candidatus Fervidibacteria bacterium JGI MDM2 JNZ-1-D12]
MAAEKTLLEEQLESLRRKLIEAGVKILSGNWGGKGGIARYKGQWLVVVDRHLPPNLKLRLLQAMCQRLTISEEQYSETRGDRDGGTPTGSPD